MQLKFNARGDMLVYDPGAPKMKGQPPRYVGRRFVPPKTETLKNVVRTLEPSCHPAVEEPFVVDSDTRDGARLIKLTRRDKCLWPADEATAKACGVGFVDTAFSDGAWVPAPKKAPLKKGAKAPQE